MAEEGIEGKAPSSLEISFPAKPVNIRKHHAYQHRSTLQAMQNRTTNCVEMHYKTPANKT